MTSDFELLNCVADRGMFGATLLIDSCWPRDFFLGSLISVAKLFTIACTRELMFLLNASIIFWFILKYYVHACVSYDTITFLHF